ncbi:hypothetical protein [Variovorax sp. DT-64]|uniref:hypothetical protein n=1 Tax=Variovorax sp. DT-64 TaxID=3396160 RepID=UPI003F19662B
MHFLAQTSAHLFSWSPLFMPPFAAFPTPCTPSLRALLLLTTVACATGLSACDPRASGGSAIRFPDDSDISQALQADFAQDTDSAKARELIQTLGGEKGQLDYKVRKVIYRQGAFEAQYDVSLRMGQSGAESLQKLYATMVPKEEAAKLPAQTLESYAKWLSESAQALEKGNPQQAAALRHMLESLDKCYRNAQPSDSVALMDGLGALISPERGGWHADKLQSPKAQFRCLPL